MVRRWLVVVVFMLLAVGACGGSNDAGGSDDGATTTAGAPATDNGGSDQPSATTTTAATEPGDEGSTSTAGEASGSVSGIGEASVTINGETYLFGETSFPALRCEPDMFGLFWVVLQMVDENGNEIPSGGSFELTLLDEGTDPAVVDQVPAAELKLTDLDQDWVANPEDIDLLGLDPGTSQVDDSTIDGNHASGTATFYEQNSYYAFTGGAADEVSVVQGSFDATCAG